VRDTLSILLLALCQAAEFRGAGEGVALGAITGKLYAAVRIRSAQVDADRSLADDIVVVSDMIRQGSVRIAVA